MVRWLTPRGTYSDEPKDCTGGCKQVGRLKLIIPELRRLAYVTALTTSIHDILQIHANLTALEGVRGDLRGIPLILRRAPRKISTPSGSNGERARREKWLITLEAQQQWVELQLTAQQQAALPQAQPLALPEWDGEEEEIEEARDYAPVQTPVPAAAPVEPASTPAVGVELVSLGTLHAIEKLWPQVGATLKGEKVSLRVWLSETKKISEPTEMPRELGEKLLGWLQQKALAKSDEAPAEQPTKADPGAGLDLWLCTQETGSRQLAMDVLNVTKRLEAAGVTEAQWRSELEGCFPIFKKGFSRRALSAEDIRETWLPLIEGWAQRAEKKKGATA